MAGMTWFSCWRRRSAALLWLLVAASAATAQVELPGALAPWRDWVAHEVPEANCPLLPGGEERLCYWPGNFQFEVGSDSARFTGTVITFGETDVPLPGSTQAWPQEVQLDGRPVAVVDNGEQPRLRLPTGRYEISGLIEFERRPEELPLPSGYALVALTLDGREVEQIRRTPGGVWLGRPEASETPQADSLELEVYRLLADGLPPRLTTQLKVNVAGRAREQRLGPVLPPGFALMQIDSPLNVRQDGNALIVQLRPGSFEITLTARALAPVTALSLALGEDPWPETEIWSYSPNAQVRESNAAGPAAIDPAQAGVPAPWHAYAAFLVDGQSALNIEVGGRGISGDEPNRLHLNRQLWLSFDATRWLAKDQVHGEMRSEWRLDAQPPFALTRAEVNGEPVLVTKSKDATGIEVRQPQPSITASAEAPFARTLPALGWQQDFESASVVMQLPPGWRLLDVGGADRVDTAWTSRFNLGVVLLTVALALVAWRLAGVALALVVVLLAVLGLGEFGETSSLLLILLAAGLLAGMLPAGRWRRLGTLGAWALFALSVLACLPFIAQQLTLALFPQLERADLSGSSAASSASALDLLLDTFGDAVGSGRQGFANEEFQSADMDGVPAAAPPPPPPAPAMEMNAPVSRAAEPQMQQNMLLAGKADSNFDQRRNKRLERYSAGTNVQAGNAEPDWRWNGHVIRFDGRVAAATELRPWLLPPWLLRLWRLAAVVAIVAVLWVVARRLQRRGMLPTGQRWLYASTGAMLCLTSTSVFAQQLPDEEWLQRIRTRLLEAPPCHNSGGCSTLARADVVADPGGIAATLQAHAQARTVVALPELAGFSWQSVSLNGSAAALHRYNEQLWIALDPGVHEVQLRVRLDRSDSVRLRFPDTPMRILCRAEGWLCSGVNEGRLLSDTLEFTPEAGDAPDTTASGVSPTRSAIAPFVQVERDFRFELDWIVETTVRRIAPREGGITVPIPLLDGEQLISEGVEVRDGKVSVSLQPGAETYSFTTQIQPVAGLELKASDWNRFAEIWRLHPGPAWHLRYAGVPPVQPEYSAEEWVHWFYPLPGEALRIEMDRPEAAAGTTLAIDNVNLRTVSGNRQQDSTLTLALRATQGGQHVIQLPAAVELTSVRLDGNLLNSKLRDGLLSIPVRPGAQQLAIEFRQDLTPQTRTELPVVDLRAPLSNIHQSQAPAERRWVLWTSGPALGPAVRFWGMLAIAVLLILALHRIGLLPMPRGHGMLLAAGSLLLFPVLLPLWLVLAAMIRWRSRRGALLRTWAFRLFQVCFVAVAVAVVMLSVLAIGERFTYGHDMWIHGLNSSRHTLYWFSDLSAGTLPTVAVYSVAGWVFQVVLLLWATAFGWLLWRWSHQAWTAFRHGGWLTPAHARQSPALPAETSADAPAASP